MKLHLVDATWNITEPAQPMTLLPPTALDRMHRDHAAMLVAYSAVDVPLLLDLATQHTESLCAALHALPADHAAFADPVD